MILQPLLPIWLLAALLGPLLGLCIWLMFRRVGHARMGTWFRRAVIVLLVGGIGLGPSIGREGVETVVSTVEVYFVVDRTGSMSADDYGDSTRLDGVRADVRAIADALPGARFSVISFDSMATRQLPLTSDVRAVRTWARTLRQELTAYSSGSLIDRPLDALNEALTASSEVTPEAIRIVYLLSDGENTATGEPQSFAALAPLVNGGAVLGYGTTAGGAMTVYSPSSIDDGRPILDYSQPGAPVAISRLDESQLTMVASQLGLPYVHRTGGVEDASVAELVAGIDLSKVAQVGRRTVTIYEYFVWPGAIALVLLGVWELSGAVARLARPVGGRTDG